MAALPHPGEALLGHPILTQMGSLDTIERKLADGVSKLVAQAYQESAGRLALNIAAEVAADTDFQAQVLASGDLAQAADDVDLLRAEGAMEPEIANERIGKIWLLAAVKERFMGESVQIEPVDEEAVEPALSDDAERLHTFFFERPLEDVAESLRGMALRAGNGDTVTITDVQAQDGEYNASFQNDPMFGDERVGAYVGVSQGSYLLYLAAGKPDECIRVTGVVAADGTKAKSGGATTKQLGISGKQQIADVKLVGKDEATTIRLVRLRDPN